MEKAGGEGKAKELLFGKRLEGIEESGLVKMVVDKLREDRGIGWWEGHGVLRRKYELNLG